MTDQAFLALAIRASNMAALVAILFTLLLIGKSLLDFSLTGPPMGREVMRQYRGVLALSLMRLALAAFLLLSLLGLVGSLAYLVGLTLFAMPYHPAAAALASLTSIGLLSFFQFCRVLHDSPGVIVASSHYAMSRFYPLWQRLSPTRLNRVALAGHLIYSLWLVSGGVALMWQGAVYSALGLAMLYGLVQLVYRAWVEEDEPLPLPVGESKKRPNLLMIGSDTLRADRLGPAGYRRALTPNLDRLAEQGAFLSHCYVPCARTAPSLLSLFTGTWPHSHGVRDNFVSDVESRVTQPALPGLLAEAGYQTAALGDWAASDLSKFDLGFQVLDVPADQWNLKFLLRQGPKDIRLFLSLFLGNHIGKFFLEEIYFLGGVPQTSRLGRQARHMLKQLGSDERPFFLNVFMASTHPPFASEYPYYTMYANPSYRGPSKFAMAKLTDPFEIIRRQGEPREEFDLEQILDLYDGCVKSFDDELGRILAYLEASGLARDTLVMVYSDHGMEFFEHETWGQGNSAIGDFSARIPVVLAGACVSAKTRLDGVTRSIDLAPTLLELLGVPHAPGMEGVSLAAAMRGGPQPELPAFYETGIWLTTLPGTPAGHLSYPGILEMLYVPDLASGTLAIKPEYQDQVVAAKDRMIRQGRWKLVYQPLADGYLLRLYDLDSDPNCRRDLAAAQPDVTARLWGLLQAWMVR
jgi:arylsulfatase A-like enzyme